MTVLYPKIRLLIDITLFMRATDDGAAAVRLLLLLLLLLLAIFSQ
jgi:hypothetical protein